MQKLAIIIFRTYALLMGKSNSLDRRVPKSRERHSASETWSTNCIWNHSCPIFYSMCHQYAFSWLNQMILTYWNWNTSLFKYINIIPFNLYFPNFLYDFITSLIYIIWSLSGLVVEYLILMFFIEVQCTEQHNNFGKYWLRGVMKEQCGSLSESNWLRPR